MTFERQRLLAAVMLTAAWVPAFTSAQGNASAPANPLAAARAGTAANTHLDALPGDAGGDAAMGERIRGAIHSDPALRGSDISVHADHGVVSLTGTVKSREQAAVASAHAQRQDGVMRVDNDLAIPLQ
jgi:osmotically-inducible protein OsmY